MPEWLWVIIIGGVVIGLVTVIYSEILTESKHSKICKENTKPIKDLILENRVIVKEQINGLREHLDLKIENTILTELRKINNRQK